MVVSVKALEASRTVLPTSVHWDARGGVMDDNREIISCTAEDERTTGVAPEISSTVIASLSGILIWCEPRSEVLLRL